MRTHRQTLGPNCETSDPDTGGMSYRAQEEDVSLSPAALEILTKIGSETSLRAFQLSAPRRSASLTPPMGTSCTGYVIQLITLSNLVARRRKATQVDVPDVRRVYTLCVSSPLFSVVAPSPRPTLTGESCRHGGGGD